MSQFHTLTVSHVKNETRDAIAVTFAVPDALRENFRFAHGQYLTLRTALHGADVRRAYSICSGAQENSLRVAIKRVPGGEFSSWAHDTLKPGYALDVMPPMGSFNTPLDAGNCKHYLGFAAGSGITPLLSIIKTTLAAEPGSRFTLCYGNRASSSVLFRDELAEVKDSYLGRFNLIYVMSRETQDIELFNGRIDGEKCDQLLRQWIKPADIDSAFICGPEDMMRAVSASLQRHGLAPSAIKSELFAATLPKHSKRAAAPQAATQECEVTLVVDRNHTVFSMARDKESILDAALRQGIDIRYSCKAGVCSTCRCKVVAGKVDMDASFALEDYEIARGFVLSCQSFPASDKVVMDFDEDN